ncbi:uncharacterized protein PAC_17419 [Phialocephala subalpina]|uniref:Uncharacterized protein n=1 Tax=Phialocephala subalpina TaxID=576137 RepID=A0A1L7XR60_9HELO|nr:uncharacterized protein PAC_17419 [Phialocephala subalpina]
MDIDSPPVSPKTVPQLALQPRARSASDPPPSSQGSQQGLGEAGQNGGAPLSKRNGHRIRHSLDSIPGLDGGIDGVVTPRASGRSGRGAIGNKPNTPNTKKQRKGRGKKKGATASGRIEKPAVQEGKKKRSSKQYTRFKAMRDDEEEAMTDKEETHYLNSMAQRNETRAQRSLRRDGPVAGGVLIGRLAKVEGSKTIKDVPTPEGDANDVADLLEGFKADDMKQYREQKGGDSDDETKDPVRPLPIAREKRVKYNAKKRAKRAAEELAGELADTIEAFKW